MEKKDHRLRIIGEILRGIKVSSYCQCYDLHTVIADVYDAVTSTLGLWTFFL